MSQVVLDAASTGDFGNLINNTSTDALSMRLLNDAGVGSSSSHNSVDVKYAGVSKEEVSKEEDDEDDDTEESDEEPVDYVERDANGLSKYELERLANIARNQDVLKSLGLARDDKLSLKKTESKLESKRKKRQMVYDNDDDEPKVGWRRAARLAGKEAVYLSLIHI